MPLDCIAAAGKARIYIQLYRGYQPNLIRSGYVLVYVHHFKLANLPLRAGAIAMAQSTYNTAEVLIYDPVGTNRGTSRSLLFSLGFRHIKSSVTLQDFNDCILHRPPDLVLCECQGADAELCAMIQALRQGHNAYNPFVVIIMTTWEKNAELIRRVIDSGADDLLIRPFSTDILHQHIEAHIENRKKFVITSDYVGPDRRRDPTRDAGVDLFTAPNSLRLKARERKNIETLNLQFEDELLAARETLDNRKLRCDSFQICVLQQLLRQSDPKMGEYQDHLMKLATLIPAVEKRARRTRFVNAGNWCQAVRVALEMVTQRADSTALNTLEQAVLGLYHLFCPELSADAHKNEVAATVARIQSRKEVSENREPVRTKLNVDRQEIAQFPKRANSAM